jgi:hypothetical protein
LWRAGSEKASEQVGKKDSEDHPADQLERPLALLTDRRAEADQGGDRGEAGLALRKQQLREVPRGDGCARGLQDRPGQVLQPPEVLPRTRGWCERHRRKLLDCEDRGPARTPGASPSYYGVGDALPAVYAERFRTQIYNERILYPGAWNELVVVAPEDDDEAMLNHALIQSRRRYRT